jgi:hypothetical protein
MADIFVIGAEVPGNYGIEFGGSFVGDEGELHRYWGWVGVGASGSETFWKIFCELYGWSFVLLIQESLEQFSCRM